MNGAREKIVSSESNPAFRELLDLLGSRGVRDHGKYLLFGERVVRERLARGTAGAATLVAVDGEPLGDVRAPVLRLAKPLFKQLDVFGTRAPILVCETPEIPDWKFESPDGLEILLALSEPSNLGACLRSAAAFGASKAILLKECASPFHPKATRAASGLTLATPLARGPSIHELPESKNLVALDMEGASLPAFDWPARGAWLLLGEEGRGTPSTLRAARVSIPMAPGCESLNAAAALSVALYAWRTRGQ